MQRGKIEKLAKRGRGLGHVTYFQILGPPNISGIAEDTNLKFCMEIDLRDTKPNKMLSYRRETVLQGAL